MKVRTRYSSIIALVILLLSLSLPSKAQLQNANKPEKKGYGVEFLGAELGMVVGGAVTGGLFLVTFLTAFAGADGVVPLALGTAGTALLTPVLSGMLIHAFGKKYNPTGKAGNAILGTFAGLFVGAGISSLLSYAGQNSQNGVVGFLSGAAGIATLVLPGLAGVYFYNKFPRNSSNMVSASLLNKNPAGWKSGLPSLSVMPHPGIPGKISAQISLLSVRL